jgi:predicted acylesterase/phospholipase RssA
MSAAAFEFPSALNLIQDGFETLAYNGTTLIFTTLETSLQGIHGTIDTIISKSVPYMGSWGLLTQEIWDSCTWTNSLYVALFLSAMFSMFGSKRLVKWPMFVICCVILVYDFIVYFSIRIAIYALETVIRVLSPSECSSAARLKKDAETYEEWLSSAQQLDALQGRVSGNLDGYNWAFLARTTYDLEQSVISHDYEGMFEALKVCTRNNVGGIMNEELYSHTHSAEPPQKIQKFVEAIVSTTDIFVDIGKDAALFKLGKQWKTRVAKMFKLAQAQYGETGLCLSGGAGFCFYSYGVVRALLDSNMLPDIISGSSGGSVVAALVCTHTNEELNEILTDEGMYDICRPFDEGWKTMIQRFIKDGSFLDPERMLAKLMDQHTRGDTTFAEAYARTGRSLNISVTVSGRGGGDPLLLNRINTPDVVIASAVLASCALPMLLKPISLLHKDPLTGDISAMNDADKYVDGSFEQDLPLQALRSNFNTKWFIVSQTEPHIVPFLFYPTGECGAPVRWRNYSGGYRGGFFLSAGEIFMKNHILFMYKFMKDLDIVPHFFGEDFGNLMIQEQMGNITLSAPLYISNYLKLFKNPTRAECCQYLLDGKKLVWQKYPMIRNRHAVHSAVKSCVEALTGKRRGRHRPMSLSPIHTSHQRAPGTTGDSDEENPKEKKNTQRLKRRRTSTRTKTPRRITR